jgi:adenylate cyclase
MEIAKEFLDLAEQQRNPAIMIARRQVGVSLLYLGELEQAHKEIEQSASLYNPAEHRPLTWLYGMEPGMVSYIYLAWSLWLLGYADQANEHLRKALELGFEVSHVQSQAYVLGVAGLIYHFRRDHKQARERAEALIALIAEQRLAYWLAPGLMIRGWAMVEQGEVAEGIDEMRRGIELYKSVGARGIQSGLPCLRAETYQKAGQPDEGLAALALAEAGAAASEAETCFERAIEIARRQKAKSLELRTVMSLARLWHGQGKTAEAYQMLADIYGWFTEGFDTTDLQEARALLDELSDKQQARRH